MAEEKTEGERVGAGKRCSKGHVWTTPWVGPDLGAIGFPEVAGGKEVCSRCLVELAIKMDCGTVQ